MLYFTPEVFRLLANQIHEHICIMLEFNFDNLCVKTSNSNTNQSTVCSYKKFITISKRWYIIDIYFQLIITISIL